MRNLDKSLGNIIIRKFIKNIAFYGYLVFKVSTFLIIWILNYDIFFYVEHYILYKKVKDKKLYTINSKYNLSN